MYQVDLKEDEVSSRYLKNRERRANTYDAITFYGGRDVDTDFCMGTD